MGAVLLALGIVLLVVGGYQSISLGLENPSFATPYPLSEQIAGQIATWRIVAVGGLVSGAIGLVMVLRRPKSPSP